MQYSITNWINKLMHNDDNSMVVSVCSLCGNEGKFSAKRKDAAHADYTFKCPCPVGDRKKFAYPTWAGRYSAQFEPRYYAPQKVVMI